MPTLSSRPSDDALDETINRDGTSSMTGSITTTSTATNNNTSTTTPISSPYRVISSENIASFGKPNAIVRPLRRTDSQEHNQSGYTNGSLENLDTQVIQHFGIINSTQQQNAHMDNLNNNVNKNNNEQSEKIDVTKEFDLKLKKLNRDTPKSSSKNSQLPLILQKRPLFITTVPKGVFLSPVRDPPVTHRRVYAYMSHPRILHNNQPFDYLESFKSSQKPSRIFAGISKITSSVAGFRIGRIRESQPNGYQNVMYEKRVIRGSNYSTTHATNIDEWNPYFAYAGLLSGKGETDFCTSREQEAIRRSQVRKKTISQRNQRGIIGTPAPVKGRRHEVVQTDKYLEELLVRPVEHDASCQTDLFLHRPPSPPFVPAKTGCDVSTEIGENDLFDFETEIHPILETIVGRTVEQSLIEIIHEEEMAEVREQQQKYLTKREAELAELKRLEEQEKRYRTEKELRLTQDEISKELDREMMERITAAKLLEGHIASLLPGVLSNIEAVTEAENREELERQLGPWLAQEVAEEVGQMIDSRDLLEEIVRDILRERAEMYTNLVNSESVMSMEEEGTLQGEDDEDEVEDDDSTEKNF